jgi:hypothetical protein
MAREGDGTVFVGIGSYEGIGLAYDWIPEIAKELKFSKIKTAAIVSRNAANKTIATMDWIHFVDNDVKNWRPMHGQDDLQVQYLKETNGKLVCFRGGEITGKVAQLALEAGLNVEILTGNSLAPNEDRLKAARAIRLDTQADGTESLVKHRKRYRNLTVTDVDKKDCKKLLRGS